MTGFALATAGTSAAAACSCRAFCEELSAVDEPLLLALGLVCRLAPLVLAALRLAAFCFLA